MKGRAVVLNCGSAPTDLARARLHQTAQHPQQRLGQHQLQAQQLNQQLQQRIAQRLRDLRSKVIHQQKLLASLGPEQTLSRGYAIVTGEDGTVIRRATQAKAGDALRVNLASGALATTVTGHPED